MSQKGIYSELKPSWWLAREGLEWPSAPKQIQLILSDLCTHDCEWCAYRWTGYSSNQLFTQGAEMSKFGHNNPIRFMATARAIELLKEFKDAGVLAVQFTGGGEPTLHDDHEIIFDSALRLGLHCSLVSNGDKWSGRLIAEILPCFDWVRVSIDAGTPDTYASTRRISAKRWERVWGHVEQLAKSIQSQKTRTLLGVGFVVSPSNWKEIPEACKIAKQSGASSIRLSAIFSPEDEKPYVDIYQDIQSIIDVAKRAHSSDDFCIYDNFGTRIEDLKHGNPDYKTCGYMRYTSYVGADANNYTCCVYAYNERGKMANLKNRSFFEWWQSKERKDFMENFDARACQRCQFNEKNRGINYIRGTTESNTVAHMEWT